MTESQVASLCHQVDLVLNGLDPQSYCGTFRHGTYISGGLPAKPFDEVYPGIILGDRFAATRLDILHSLGVTHVVNCCLGTSEGHFYVSPQFYRSSGIDFYGFDSEDMPYFNITPYLYPAADFMHIGVASGGVVFVHCFMGVSRSATLVLAYLMLYHNMRLLDATRVVHARREIYPNPGFVRQLAILDIRLHAPGASSS